MSELQQKLAITLANKLSQRKKNGFTLVELLIGLVILSILVAVAAPSFSTAMAQQRLRQASSELRSTVAIARSEAVKRNAQVRLLPRTGGWSNGWCSSIRSYAWLIIIFSTR